MIEAQDQTGHDQSGNMLDLFIELGVSNVQRTGGPVMPRASVGIGPARIGSGCCVVLLVPTLIVMTVMFFALGGTAIASKQYVLKHPRHEHCKAYYVKKTKKHKTYCIYVAPKKVPIKPVATAPDPTVVATSTPVATPVPSTPVVPPTPTPEPFATTTTLSETPVATSGCTDNGNGEYEFCEYTVTYSTTNSHGDSPPGAGPVLESRIPPATISEPITVPSGSLLRVAWFINIHNECIIYATINHTNTEVADGTCERANPRIVLTANYAHPASGWLASQSEPVTIR
jgi:hypothetical protein